MGGGTVYGMCKAALERFSTGLAAEVFDDGIAVNALSPTGLVATPGVVHHKLDKLVPKEFHEPMERMVEAAYALCTGDPAGADRSRHLRQAPRRRTRADSTKAS